MYLLEETSSFTFHGISSHNYIIKDFFHKLSCQFSSIKHSSAAVAETVVLAQSYDVTHGAKPPDWLVADAGETLPSRVISSAIRCPENVFFSLEHSLD